MRTKETFLASQGRRWVVRLGKKKALIAVAHSLLVIVYHVLSKHEAYKELGSAYYDQRDTEAAKRRAVRKLEGLGYAVTLQPMEQLA